MNLRQHRGLMTTKTTVAPMIVGSNRCSFTNRLQDLARKKEALKSMSGFLVRCTTLTWTSISTAFVPTHSAGTDQTPTSGMETGSLTKCRFHPISMCYMKFFSAAVRFG
jgi:hypothetical protein